MSTDKIHIYNSAGSTEREPTEAEVADGVERIEVFERPQWRWRQVARNGRTRLASSEGFASKQKCIQNLEAGLRGRILADQFVCAEINDKGSQLIRIPVVFS